MRKWEGAVISTVLHGYLELCVRIWHGCCARDAACARDSCESRGLHESCRLPEPGLASRAGPGVRGGRPGRPVSQPVQFLRRFEFPVRARPVRQGGSGGVEFERPKSRDPAGPL